MKKTILIAAFVLSALCFQSCFKSDYLFSVTVMGNMEGTDLIGDDGIRYSFSNRSQYPGIDTLKRVLAYAAVTEKKSETQYTATLEGLISILTKDLVLKSAANDSELGDDAVYPEGFWIEGGYLNTKFLITSKYGSKTAHTINLLKDDIRSNADTLYLELRHNAFGESFEDSPEETEDQFITQYGYASFPYTSADISEGKVIVIDYDWLKTIDGYYYRELVHGSLKGTYQK